MLLRINEKKQLARVPSERNVKELELEQFLVEDADDTSKQLEILTQHFNR